MYHFLVERKPHERIYISIDYNMHEHLPDKKKEKKYSNSNEYMPFWRKTDKAIWKPSFLREPPFQLTPYFWATFSWPPSLSKFENKKPPPPPNFFWGGGNYDCSLQKSPVIIGQSVIGG